MTAYDFLATSTWTNCLHHCSHTSQLFDEMISHMSESAMVFSIILAIAKPTLNRGTACSGYQPHRSPPVHIDIHMHNLFYSVFLYVVTLLHLHMFPKQGSPRAHEVLTVYVPPRAPWLKKLKQPGRKPTYVLNKLQKHSHQCLCSTLMSKTHMVK